MKTLPLAAMLLVLLSAGASAEVMMTEIMYNPSGSDTGREWVEFHSTSGADLFGWKLWQSGNHNLALVQGSWNLTAGETAVISSNPAKFLADYPEYAGTLLGSSFTLSNSGTLLRLMVGEAEMDSVNYTAIAEEGRSIALTNLLLDNSLGTSWAMGEVGGTPGQVPSSLPSGDGGVGNPGNATQGEEPPEHEVPEFSPFGAAALLLGASLFLSRRR